MKLTAVAAVAALGVAMAGCATIVKGTTQSIAISTPPTTGAQCVLASKEGTWTVVSPGVATGVHKSRRDIQVTCQKPGWQTATAMIPSNFQGWTAGNIIIGGIVGIGVDAASGAMNQYPDAFQVPMQPDPNAPKAEMKPMDNGKPTS